MSLKYGRSILFDKPQQTIAGMQIQTIVYDLKQRLDLHRISHSSERKKSPERLSLGQAKFMEALKAKIGSTVTFHSLYCQYQKDGARLTENREINPERMKLFREGKYRCARSGKYRPENKEDLKEYYQRIPEEQTMPSKTQTISFSRQFSHSRISKKTTSSVGLRRKSVI